mgnify:CR=1 FL=1
MFVIIKKEKYMEKPDSSLLFRQPMYADKNNGNNFFLFFC